MFSGTYNSSELLYVLKKHGHTITDDGHTIVFRTKMRLEFL